MLPCTTAGVTFASSSCTKAHRVVGAHHLGSEAAYPALARYVGQMSEQQPADAAPLHVVDDGDRDFRGIAALMESNEACHANDHVGAAAAPRCQSR
jgi:NADPH-dependent ferric siderophore reductase